jgi:predicted amidohydrolase YtcJ
VNRPGPERISAEQALACYTRESAYAEFMEAEKGVLAPGMLADLAVLSEDPTAVAPAHIRDIRVQRTIVGGSTVFERPM